MNMFEIEKEIFTTVATALISSSPSCRVVNAFVYAPDHFPTVSIVFSDDGTTPGMRDSSRADNYRDVTIVADAFSNKVNGKKGEAESLMQTVIDTLCPYNFDMVSCRPNSNVSNAQTYKITATFTATVDKDGNIFTRR